MATDVLSNHKIDAKYYENQKRNKERNTNQQEEEATPAATSFAQKDVVCYVCGKPGHTKPECPDATKIPRAKWAVNKAIGAMQATKDSDDDENFDNDSDNESVKSEASTSSRSARRSKSNHKGKSGWNSFQRPVKVDVSQMVHKQSKKGNSELEESLKNVILLDTGSSIGATFMNPDMVTDIKMSNQPIQMNTNAGFKILGLEGQVPGFGKVYYDPTMMTNIFGFGKLVSKYRIVYDSDVEDAFKVYTNEGVIKFKQNKEGLYVYRPSEKY